MGSQEIQGKLWGQRPEDWAHIQEKTGMAGYEHALKLLTPARGQTLLDVGCGSGLFSSLAFTKGMSVTGIDASDKLIEEAKKRVPAGDFTIGEMENLPFENNAFDVVCGFNSFQYAGNVKNALTDARRVLKDRGKLVTMVWGNKEDCEAAAYLKAVGSKLPPPPPGAPGPFALSEGGLLENLLEEVGVTILDNTDVVSLWDYPDYETALKGLMAAGPVARAIEVSGFDSVRAAISESIKPYVQSNGHIVFKNKFRVITSRK